MEKCPAILDRVVGNVCSQKLGYPPKPRRRRKGGSSTKAI